MRTGELGFWWRSLGGAVATRPPMEGPAEVDVAIVGAGFTGLWTAYYLKRADPSLEVVVLEREMAGYGASGRNGGWVSGFFSGPPRVYERSGGSDRFIALQRAMFETVDEIGRVLAERDIDADYVKGGQLSVALNAAQVARLADQVASGRRHGLAEADLRELSGAELGRRVR
ncbi:MAG: dependent oxidoreductase, partial [Solirubrobacterales bacterium]|nr:dependent oxidoreductase [Solirubrobacterales bacterium]